VVEADEVAGIEYVPVAAAAGHGWDDQFGGHTDDWVYADDEAACQIAFALGPGGFFRHANGGHDVWDRDVVWRIVEGTLVVGDPVAGGVVRVTAGDWLRFPGTVWLDGVNAGLGPVHAVEFTAPTRRATPSRSWRELPTEPAYRSNASGTTDPVASCAVVTVRDLDWRIDEGEPPLVRGSVPNTRHLTAGELTLVPGQRSGEFAHGDACATFYVVAGRALLRSEVTALDLGPRDGARLAVGVPYRLENAGDEPTTVLFQLVPHPAGAERA
jgi:mannose-6-phosphate isomerase-like protein (cupin superfamily)